MVEIEKPPNKVKRLYSLTPSQEDFLVKEAKRLDLSHSEFLRRIIDDYRSESLSYRRIGRLTMPKCR